MNDWLDASIRLQKQMLDATTQSLEAGRDTVDMDAAMTAAREASRKATEANLAAYQAWLRLWGVQW